MPLQTTTEFGRRGDTTVGDGCAPPHPVPLPRDIVIVYFVVFLLSCLYRIHLACFIHSFPTFVGLQLRYSHFSERKYFTLKYYFVFLHGAKDGLSLPFTSETVACLRVLRDPSRSARVPAVEVSLRV